LSAATGTFGGNLSAAGGTFSGALSAATGTFGDVASGQYIEFSGSVLEFGDNATIGDNTDRTITVGSGGDYSTINDALEALSRVVPAYKSGGFTATINCLSGYEDTDTHSIVGVDLSWIEIDSATGTLSIDNTADETVWMSVTRHGIAPNIKCDVDVINGRFQFMFFLDNFSHISGDNGIEFTTTTTGIQPDRVFAKAKNGSSISFPNCAWNSFASIFEAEVACHANCASPNVTDCGIFSSLENDSTMQCMDGTFTNISAAVLSVRSGSKANINGSSLVGTRPNFGILVISSDVIADECDFSDCDVSAVAANEGSIVRFARGDATKGGGTATDDIVVEGGSIVYAFNSDGGSSVTTNTITADGIIFK